MNPFNLIPAVSVLVSEAPAFEKMFADVVKAVQDFRAGKLSADDVKQIFTDAGAAVPAIVSVVKAAGA